MNLDVYMVGVGGQGVLTIGDILVLAAAQAGIPANFYPTKGMAQRGGFTGKRCFLTGAASGIGRATALKLAAEGAELYQPACTLPERGWFHAPTLFTGVSQSHRIAQEEVFGPILSVMKAKNFEQALEWANSTRYALTGSVFSRSPRNLEKARAEFNVGNLYLNRGSTGALVERHPFGGFNMSGIGSKAGGPDYLLQFMDPRVVCENTMRRGFAPIEADDDWII